MSQLRLHSRHIFFIFCLFYLPMANAMMGTPGEFSVSPSGAATYTIPIQVPPGTAGMQPNLSLVYNSQMGNGLFGMGWSLQGLPVIHRCPATIAQDGYKGGINYDAKDRFCMNGQRLVAINGAYGADNTEYRTEIESFAKIISYGQAGSGPAWFKVWTKEGQVMEFGNTVDSRIEAMSRADVRVWSINKVMDTVGNYLTVSYDEKNLKGQYCPTRIDYTANDATGLAAQRSVVFEYETRLDARMVYMAGSKVITDQRVASIKAYTNQSKTKDYKLSYSYKGGNAKQSILANIQECDLSGNCLPTISFDTENRPEGLSQDNSWIIPDGTYFTSGSTDNGVIVIDVNGDGLEDVLQAAYLSYVGMVRHTYINTGIGFIDDASWHVPFDDPRGASQFSVAGTDVGLRVVDLNGDGLPDLLHSYFSTNSWYGGGNVQRAYINTGSGFRRDDSWAVPGNSHFAVGNFDSGMRIIDLNGDGLPDLLHSYFSTNGYYGGGNQQRAYINTGKGFVQDDSWAVPGNSHFNVGTADSGMQIIDLNGDGLPDLLHAFYSTNSWYGGGSIRHAYINTGSGFVEDNKWNLPGPGDFSAGGTDVGLRAIDLNADGLPDLLQSYYSTNGWYGGGNQQRAYINTGDGFAQDNSWAVPGDSYFNVGSFDSGMRVAYLNADPLPDLIQSYYRAKGVYGGGTVKRAYINTGSGFVQDNSWNIPGDSHFNLGSSDGGMRVIDLNGDGISDFLQSYYSTNGWYGGGAVKRAYINSGSRISEISRISNAGEISQITYAPLTNSIVYEKSIDAEHPVIDIQNTQYVVSNHASSDGLGGMYQVDYHYAGLKADLLGRGSLGFREVSMTDSRTGISTSSTYRQDFPFIGVAELSETRLSDGTLVKSTDATPSVTEQGSGTSKNYFVHIDAANEQVYELDGSLVTSTSTTTHYDSYGNPTQIVVDSNDGYKKTTTNTYTNDTTNWHLGRLTRASVTSQSPLQGSATRTSAFTYKSGTGLLSSEIIEPDDPAYRLTTQYSYDPYGNKTSVTISGAGITSRTTSTTYDAVYHTFPATVTNAAGHTETRGYEATFGQRTKLTGPNGLSTDWTYDGFGRVLTETRADGTQTTKTYTYCQSNCPHGSPFYVTTATSGAPSTTMYVDILGREIATESQGFSGVTVFKDSEYDTLGRVARVSSPYYAGDTTYWTEYSYDVLGRVTEEVNPDGSTTSRQYNGLSTTTINDKGQVITKVIDSQGQLIESIDALKNSSHYDYDPFGNLARVTDPVGNVSSMTYDLRGRKTAMNDPDMGAWSYTYNVLGELTQQRDAKGQVVSMEYDVLGRLVKRTEPEGISTWVYDTAVKGIGKLAEANGPSGYQRKVSYDNLGRLDWTNTIINGSPYVVQTSFDSYGRVDTLSYPTGLQIRNVYTALGYLKEVRNAANNSLYWQAAAVNAQGQITQFTLGNGLTTVNSYSPTTNRISGITTGIGTASNIQNLSYGFDSLGNLVARNDLNQGLAETFNYDDLNRLTTTNFQGLGSKTYQYDTLGNITYKSDVGNYLYGANGAGPHAVTSTTGTRNNTYAYDANGNQVSGAGRTLSYTSFNKPLTITRDTTTVAYAYDTERNRIKKTTNTSTTIYIGKLYERVQTGSVLEHKQYISAGGNTFAVLNTKGATTETRYLHKDHLGSTDVITDELGAVVERQSFDPHGLRRYTDWQPTPIGISLTSAITTRGFTGHEMDGEIGLVNMNARMYDPVLGRFLTPDTYVQFPDNAQSYNRYTYVNNNPLSFTDPSGHFLGGLFKSIKRLVSSVYNSVKSYIRPIAAIAIASIPGINIYAAGFISGFIAGGDLRSAIGGAITAGLFSAVHGIEGFAGVLAHGTIGGISAEINGGDFGAGFLSGGFTKFASQRGLFDKLGDPSTSAGRVKNAIAAAVVGGTASVLGGGKFKNGAITGAFSRLFNDLSHSDLNSGYDPNDVRGGFTETGESLVYHPDFYNPSAASGVLILGGLTVMSAELIVLRGIGVSIEESLAIKLFNDASITAGTIREAGLMTRLVAEGKGPIVSRTAQLMGRTVEGRAELNRIGIVVGKFLPAASSPEAVNAMKTVLELTQQFK